MLSQRLNATGFMCKWNFEIFWATCNTYIERSIGQILRLQWILHSTHTILIYSKCQIFMFDCSANVWQVLSYINTMQCHSEHHASELNFSAFSSNERYEKNQKYRVSELSVVCVVVMYTNLNNQIREEFELRIFVSCGNDTR